MLEGIEVCSLHGRIARVTYYSSGWAPSPGYEVWLARGRCATSSKQTFRCASRRRERHSKARPTEGHLLGWPRSGHGS